MLINDFTKLAVYESNSKMPKCISQKLNNCVSDISGCTVDYKIAYTEEPDNFLYEIVDSALDCAVYAKSIGGALFWSWNHQNQAC